MVDVDVGREPRARQAGVDRVVAEAMDDGVHAGAVPGIRPFAGRDAAEGAILVDRNRGTAAVADVGSKASRTGCGHDGPPPRSLHVWMGTS